MSIEDRVRHRLLAGVLLVLTLLGTVAPAVSLALIGGSTAAEPAMASLWIVPNGDCEDGHCGL